MELSVCMELWMGTSLLRVTEGQGDNPVRSENPRVSDG